MPPQTLEGVMRSLDLVKHAMEEALAVAAAMPEESAIMPSPSEGGLMDATDIQEPPVRDSLCAQSMLPCKADICGFADVTGPRGGSGGASGAASGGAGGGRRRGRCRVELQR